MIACQHEGGRSASLKCLGVLPRPSLLLILRTRGCFRAKHSEPTPSDLTSATMKVRNFFGACVAFKRMSEEVHTHQRRASPLRHLWRLPFQIFGPCKLDGRMRGRRILGCCFTVLGPHPQLLDHQPASSSRRPMGQRKYCAAAVARMIRMPSERWLHFACRGQGAKCCARHCTAKHAVSVAR